jgi:thiol-disulfide isomerase/thioredoxin
VVASTLEKGAEKSIAAKPTVNASSYRTFHSAQMFEQGFSFSGFERNKVWLNAGGRFVDLSDVSGADTPNDSRAAIAADLDDDGDVDLFVHNLQRERHALYRNDVHAPGTRGFLKLRLSATRSNAEAIGAIVTVRGPLGPVSQSVARGDGFLSCRGTELVFGLGDAREAEVEVLWPGGARESFGKLTAGTRARLVEGTGHPEPYTARPRPLPDPLPQGLQLAEGDSLPNLALADASGAMRVLDARALGGGKPVLLNLWASYCAPCVAELPLLAAKHAQGEVAVVALSLDVPDDRPAAAQLLAEKAPRLAAFYLPASGAAAPEGSVAIEQILDLERLSLPTTLVLSREGKLETILRGPLAGER